MDRRELKDVLAILHENRRQFDLQNWYPREYDSLMKLIRRLEDELESVKSASI